MTPIEVYDLALKAGSKEPSVLQMGEECVLGFWERKERARKFTTILAGKTRCMVVVFRGSSWEEVAHKAGFLPHS